MCAKQISTNFATAGETEGPQWVESGRWRGTLSGTLAGVYLGELAIVLAASADFVGRSGLGLDAQKKAACDYLNGGSWSLLDEVTEIETGKRNDRPELRRALALCRKHKAKLVIAKLDRLSRNLASIAALMDSNVEFVAVDNPHANKLTLHICSRRAA